MPKRIQRKRTKGWRMPEGAVSVCRPGKWGNRFKLGGEYLVTDEQGIRTVVVKNAQEAVDLFREWLRNDEVGRELARRAREELRGKDLACFCHPSQPCHADVLLQVANTEGMF